MAYAEALREVKKAESDVRDQKAEAQRAAQQILRDAERQANQLLEQARQEAEANYAKAQDAARAAGDKERTKRIAGGEKDATLVKARAAGPEFKAAVDTLMANLERRVSGK